MGTFLRANARWIAGGFLLTLFSSFGQTFFIGLSGEELRARFSLSDGQFGVIYMMATLASAATLPWLGRILDVWSGRTVAGLVLPALAASCLLMALSPNLLMMMLAIYLLRLFGQGMMTHTALTEINRWFVAGRGRATSLVVPGHQAGEAIFPLSFAVVAAVWGWQAGWIIGAALILIVALPAILLLWRIDRIPGDSDSALAGPRTARDWTVGAVLRDPAFYLLLMGVLAPPFIGTTVFFHQDYFIEQRGYDPMAFAAAFPAMAVTTVGFALLCGHLIDRLGALRLLPVFLLPLALATVTAALLTPVWGVYVFMVLMGVSYGFTSTLLGALWPEVYGLLHLGAIRSLIVSAMVFSTALGPGLTGLLIDLGIGLGQQLVWMSVWCLGASLILAAVAPRLRRRQAEASPAGTRRSPA